VTIALDARLSGLSFADARHITKSYPTDRCLCMQLYALIHLYDKLVLTMMPL
jgi:hypothetical protein